MIVTDYYKFERVARKAKTRMDCVASTHSYPEFEDRVATKANKETEKRDKTEVGDLVIYYSNVPPQFKASAHDKANKCISIKGKNVSSVYVPDINKSIAFGDCKGTTDALLFVFSKLQTINGAIQDGATIEVFVARGKSKDSIPLFNLFSDGELDEELEVLRKKATPHKSGIS